MSTVKIQPITVADLTALKNLSSGLDFIFTDQGKPTVVVNDDAMFYWEQGSTATPDDVTVVQSNVLSGGRWLRLQYGDPVVDTDPATKDYVDDAIDTVIAGEGTVTNVATTAPLSGGPITTTGTLSIAKSDTSTDGYLSSTDWNTFNNKGSGTVTSIATASGISGGTITSTGTISLNLANQNAWTAEQDVIKSITTAQTVGFSAQSSTNAISGTQAYSAMYEMVGSGWKTNSTAAAQSVKSAFQLRPKQAAANPQSDTVLWTSINGGAYTELFKFSNYAISTQAVGAFGDYSIGTPSGFSAQFGCSSVAMIVTSDNIFRFAYGASTYYIMTTVSFSNNGNGASMGQSNLPWAGAWTTYLSETVGSVLTIESNAISPTTGIHHVATGTNNLNTINLPATSFTGTIALIPDGTWTYTSSGNITVALGGGIAVVNRTMYATYDGSKWNMSY